MLDRLKKEGGRSGENGGQQNQLREAVEGAGEGGKGHDLYLSAP